MLSAKVIAQFTPHSRTAWLVMREFRAQFYANCRGLWTIYHGNLPLCVIGLGDSTMLGLGNEIYLLLCRNATSHMRELVRFIRRVLRKMLRLCGRLITSVEEGFWIGSRFVEFFGFRKMAFERPFETTPHTMYEMRAEWL
jgi:hypothetical protein